MTDTSHTPATGDATRPSAAPRKPDWRLRGGLLGALLALLLTVAIVEAMPRPAPVLAPVAAKAHGHRQVHVARPTPPQGPSRPATVPATPSVAGAVYGRVTKAHASGNCGFALAATARQAPVGSCTVLEIGDSLGNDLGWGLQRHVAPDSGLTLVQLDKSSTGLANTSFYDWPAQLAADLRRYHPQLVLISLGGNDEQGMEVGRSTVQFPTPAWQRAYVARVRRLVGEATSSGAYALWVGMPVMQQPSYASGMRILDGIYRSVVASTANATFLSTSSLFANPQGAFQSTALVNGRRASLRQADGVHYSFAGEDVLATYVIRKMALIYHVRLAPENPATITGWG